jgi:hypothetical protein
MRLNLYGFSSFDQGKRKLGRCCALASAENCVRLIRSDSELPAERNMMKNMFTRAVISPSTRLLHIMGCLGPGFSECIIKIYTVGGGRQRTAIGFYSISLKCVTDAREAMATRN